MAVDVRRAAAGDVGEVAAALGAAFDGDPWIGWIVAADRHRERVTALHAGLLDLVGIPHGEVWLARDGPAGGAGAGHGGPVVGGALWLLASRDVPVEAWAQVAAREADLMGDRHAGAAAAAAATRHLRPHGAHHLLASLGVLPPARGRGIGRALLAPVLEQADRDEVDAYVETSTERNLRFYGRLGFTVTGRAQVPGGGPPVWALLRRPARAAPASPGARS
jgi:ribosomal protein S18 acetylase RimI-like enzyme